MHEPTGARVVLLPAPRRLRIVRALHERLRSRRGGQYKALGSLASYLSVPIARFQRELRREQAVALLNQEYEHARFDLFVLLGRLARRPVYASFQGRTAPFSRLERWIRPRTSRACAGLIIGTGTERARVQNDYGVEPRRIAGISNLRDIEAYAGADRSVARHRLNMSPTACVVVWHGRVVIHRKGLNLFLDAWQRVGEERPDTELLLLLVGTGADAPTLHARIAGMTLVGVQWRDEHVTDRTELFTYLSAADMYVIPSRHEGFPVAPLEAMATGLPIIACDAPGVSDILEHGESSGGVVVPREVIDALAIALGRLIDDPELARTLGQRARSRVAARFALQAVGSELRSVLLRAC